TVACAAGSGADTSILKQITDNVVSLDTADSSSIGKFFLWVTASIGVTSTKVEDSGQEVTGLKELPPPPAELNIVV
nr:tellurium resistance protein TerY [Chitinophagaceae bacterium]